MRKYLSVMLIVALVAVPATAAQAEEPETVEIVVHDDSDACREQAPCLEVVDNAWSGIYAGDEIHVVFENAASQAHGLAIVPGEAQDEERPTGTEDAFLAIDPIAPGETVEQTVRVPEGTDTAYLFCEDHEDEGMHLLRNVYPADAKGEEGEYTTMDEDEGASDDEDTEAPAGEDEAEQADENEAPLPLAAGLVGLVLAAGLGRRRS